MPRAIDVANYLIYLAESEEEPDYLTNLRLQKLLYYIQGWSLALHGKAMFPDRIEAWAHGPVVPTIYHKFKDFGHHAFSFDGKVPEIPLGEEERTFISDVWDSYKEYSATSLRQMTHSETPWIDARKGYGPTDSCNVEISHESMRAFFTRRIKQQ